MTLFEMLVGLAAVHGRGCQPVRADAQAHLRAAAGPADLAGGYPASGWPCWSWGRWARSRTSVTPTAMPSPTPCWPEPLDTQPKEARPATAAGGPLDTAAVTRQLRQLPVAGHRVLGLPLRTRRVQNFNNDPRLERALSMAEATCMHDTDPRGCESVARALSRIQSLRTASLMAAYADQEAKGPPGAHAATEAAKAAAAAAACAAARCIEDAAADAAFAARSAMAALADAGESTRLFWSDARTDFQTLLKAGLGPQGSIGQPIPAGLFK